MTTTGLLRHVIALKLLCKGNGMSKEFFLYPFLKGQVVTLKKTHPCGGRTWLLIRVSGDVTMECLTCGRKMILQRSDLEKACVRVDHPTRDTSGPL